MLLDFIVWQYIEDQNKLLNSADLSFYNHDYYS